MTTSPALPIISNSDARRLFLHKHGLADNPSGKGKGDDLLSVIDHIGFVQVDSVKTVMRAHDMILFARRSNYREKHLPPLLEKHRNLFEHWTHDASVLPIEAFSHWKRRFRHNRQHLSARWQSGGREGFERQIDAILKQVDESGPLGTSDVGKDEARKSGGWWDWNPSKTALEYLWRVGDLSITRRDGFQKIYDLTERVIPEAHRLQFHEDEATIDWACRSAFGHLGFATPAEIAGFYDLVTRAEANAWCEKALANGTIVTAQLEASDGQPSRPTFTTPDALASLGNLTPATSRLRILSPFDPMLRDRKRALRLFGFDYRIEIFVPEPQRKYGYYVFPVLEGERLVGRIDMKAFQAEDCLKVKAYWPEKGLKLSKGREVKLQAELHRMARFCGVSDVRFEADWLRPTLSA